MISLRTPRHWKGTVEAYKTRDPFYVQRVLRHKSIKNTEKYIHFAETAMGSGLPEEYTAKIAETIAEFTKMLEGGFDYIGDCDGKRSWENENDGISDRKRGCFRA